MNITALAVIIDSAVTVGVGWRLNRTAKKEVKKAVEDISPAIHAAMQDIAEQYQKEIKKEIGRAIQKVIPLVVMGVKKFHSESNTQLLDKEASTQTQIQHSDQP